MMNQAEKTAKRTEVVEQAAELLKVEGFEFAGFTTEGAAFTDGEDAFVVKAIMKSAKFDLEDAIAEKAEKDAAAKERAKKQAEKKAKKED